MKFFRVFFWEREREKARASEIEMRGLFFQNEKKKRLTR